MKVKIKTQIKTQIKKILSREWIILLSVTLGVFIINLDSSVLTVAFPVLMDYFQVSTQDLQWVITAYFLMITSLLPVMGKLSDLMGRKRIYILGVIIFTISSSLCALSESVPQLITYRVIQAIGGSMITANAMSIITIVFKEKNRGIALGGIGSMAAIATIVGPALGGVIISNFTWKAIFYINIPIGLLSIILTLLFLKIEEGNFKGKLDFDYVGAIFLATAIISFVLFISNGNQWGWISGFSIVCLLLSLLLFKGFITWESKQKNPLIHLKLFQNRLFTWGNVASWICFILILIPSIILPLFMKKELNLSIKDIGFLMTTQAIMTILVSPISGWMSDKINSIRPAIVGLFLCIFGFIGMAQFNQSTSYFVMIISLSFFGAGIGMFQTPVNLLILQKVPSEDMGIAGSIMATVRNFGKLSGVAIIMALYQLLDHTYWIGKVSRPISLIFYFGIGLCIVNFFLIIVCRKSLKECELPEMDQQNHVNQA